MLTHVVGHVVYWHTTHVCEFIAILCMSIYSHIDIHTWICLFYASSPLMLVVHKIQGFQAFFVIHRTVCVYADDLSCLGCLQGRQSRLPLHLTVRLAVRNMSERGNFDTKFYTIHVYIMICLWDLNKYPHTACSLSRCVSIAAICVCACMHHIIDSYIYIYIYIYTYVYVTVCMYQAVQSCAMTEMCIKSS